MGHLKPIQVKASLILTRSVSLEQSACTGRLAKVAKLAKLSRNEQAQDPFAICILLTLEFNLEISNVERDFGLFIFFSHSFLPCLFEVESLHFRLPRQPAGHPATIIPRRKPFPGPAAASSLPSAAAAVSPVRAPLQPWVLPTASSSTVGPMAGSWPKLTATM